MDFRLKRRSFEERILPHLDAAYNLARWLIRDPGRAEDAVQEAFLRAFRSFDSLAGRGDAEARGWLLAIVRNTCISDLRKNGKVSELEFDEQTQPGEEGTAEDVMIRNADLSRLNGCVQALPDEFREAVVLRDLEELPYSEVASVTGVPVGTVMSRLSRARKKLRTCMEGSGK